MVRRRHYAPFVAATGIVACALGLAGCGGSVTRGLRRGSSEASTSATGSRSGTGSPPAGTSGNGQEPVRGATTLPTATTAPAVPSFSSVVSPVTTAELGATWHPGCPVGPSELSQLQLSYWGFDGRSHTGTIVVATTMVDAVSQVFATLYAARFPIAEMIPESAYGGDDNAAAAADDTSGFNCRYAVAPGPPQWSVHAYGEAIDVNDVQNPYVDGATVIPPAGAAYEDRADVRPGMAVPGGTLVTAFAAVGWQWGGRWAATPDYQHFSATGH